MRRLVEESGCSVAPACVRPPAPVQAPGSPGLQCSLGHCPSWGPLSNVGSFPCQRTSHPTTWKVKGQLGTGAGLVLSLPTKPGLAAATWPMTPRLSQGPPGTPACFRHLVCPQAHMSPSCSHSSMLPFFQCLSNLGSYQQCVSGRGGRGMALPTWLVRMDAGVSRRSLGGR